MPTITFTKVSSRIEQSLRDFCPPDSINSVNATLLPSEVLVVDLAASAQADAIEFMESKGYEVTLIVP